ncbi:MAG: hypothetical protein J6A29_03940 [Clostridia bacterium]|nr:hypothetical protein [Clostridia bacterium]
MYKLIRIINQNRKQILIAILAIVFVITTIQILNNVAKKSNEEKENELKNNNSKYDTSTHNPNYSIISGGSVSQSTQNTVNKIIDNFMTSCNKGDVQTAYNLLSENCKEELYPTLEDFTKNYYMNNFKTNKQYSVQLWSKEKLMYKIELYEDILSTGKVDTTTSRQDFFTIVKENGENKLNISEYIGKKIIEKSTTKEGITITANYKNVYKDYEIYNITIKNSTNNNILLNSNESTKTIYLKGENGAEYTAYIYEINSNVMELDSYNKITTNIKFNKQYSSNNGVSLIAFDDIILNAEEYENMKNKLEYKDRIKIQIEI